MNKLPKEIISTFSYSEADQETFDYLRDYMKLVEPDFLGIESNSEKLKRFALVGLFLDYRASNHMGEDLTTEMDFDDNEHPYAKRIITMRESLDTKICDNNHYLKLINYSILDHIFIGLQIKSISKKFYRFVITGR